MFLHVYNNSLEKRYEYRKLCFLQTNFIFRTIHEEIIFILLLLTFILVIHIIKNAIIMYTLKPTFCMSYFMLLLMNDALF